jgi:hypothetical protein
VVEERPLHGDAESGELCFHGVTLPGGQGG